ncbi:OmpA family protein [Roseococcus sp. SYP-B2431]|uniref:OmpA family protein n=1 Tax=Roseococcus sp. SYP-B2431 TaxID=2496640 RepID=UPI0019801D69|nr:OmpA family protein [Roseococcus sp. SYP-B2431]
MIAPFTRLALGATLLAMAACAEAPAPAPVVAAPPPPAPAAPPPAASLDGRQALPIFFEPWSAALDEPAEGALRDAAKLAQENPSVRILVVGYADPRGSRAANISLSRLRARVVADFLAANGVAATRIRTLYRGPVAGMEGIESRRVQVQVDRGQR